MRRLRSWSGSPRSRARESIATSTFIRKTHMIWKSFFRVFAARSQTHHFYSELSPLRWPSFHDFDCQLAKIHFWPKRDQWDPIGTQFDPIWIKFDPNGVNLGPNWAQYIFTNSRSTAPADVMLTSYVYPCLATTMCPLRLMDIILQHPHPPYTPENVDLHPTPPAGGRRRSRGGGVQVHIFWGIGG